MAGDQPPKWVEALLAGQKALLDKQTVNLAEAMSQQLAGYLTPGPTEPSTSSLPDDCSQPDENQPPLKKAKICSVVDDDDEDEFDRRFGHLFNKNEDESSHHSSDEGLVDNTNKPAVPNGDEDDNVSVDDDLVGLSDKDVNWEISSSLSKFVKDSADKRLSEDALRQIDDSYIPDEALQPCYGAPKLPKTLYRRINRLKNKSAARTERALYNSQMELLVSAKPLVAALAALRPLGAKVSQAREQLSVSLGCIFSASLGISKARRENIRFLFKTSLADSLYDCEPTHTSLFGGTSFASQLDKASKEAKLDSSINKKQEFKQPFRSRPGFLGQRFLGRYSYGDRRFGSSQARGFTSSNSNNNSYRKKPYSGKQYAKKRQYQK